MKLKCLYFLIICLISVDTLAQKVKYKDLFVLLNAKRFDEAEPYLRLFLANDKNDDHANAHLQMGNILKEKALAADILADDHYATELADSAVYFYEKAIEFIDDREVRKNDEYYDYYTRRDLRTGKVGINVSDIHFDLKKRIEQLQERILAVKDLKRLYEQYSKQYLKAANLLTEIQNTYPDTRTLLLRGDEMLLEKLDSIRYSYNNSVSTFSRYRSLLTNTSDVSYNQQWNEQPYEFGNASLTDVDFKADVFKAYNLGKWAEETNEIISDEIIPLKKHILKYDIDLDGLHQKLSRDSVSVKDELTTLSQRMLTQQLEKHDKNPLPLQLFRLRLAELGYISMLMEYNHNKDSADVFYQLEHVIAQQKKLNEMDSIVNLLIGINLTEEVLNYEEFVSVRYGSGEKIQEFIKSRLDFVLEENKRLKEIEESRRNRINWMAYEQDTIPIVLTDTLHSYRPIEVVDEKYSTGLKTNNNQLTGGYFTDINPSRRSRIKIDIDLNPEVFDPSNVSNTNIISTSDQEDQIYYVVIVQPTNDSTAYKSAISKIYTVDGLAWSNSFELPSSPAGLYYQPDTGDLVINLKDQNRIIIDKEGVRKEEEL